MSDNATAAPFNPADQLYGNLDKSPAQLAASFSAGVNKAVPVAGNLLPDPDDSAGHDPADPVPAKDPGNYDLQPDSAVTAPEEAAPAAEPAPAAPTLEPVDLAPVFTQALDDYNAAAQAAQEAAQRLADLQGNAEGIVEFTPEMAAALEAKMKAEAAAEKTFEEIGDDALELAMENYPELRDDSHPATIAVKRLLATPAGRELANSSPTAVAEHAAAVAADIRANAPKYPAVPVSQPQPAPGPVPAKAPAAPASSSVAMAQRPAPGQPATPDIVAQVKAAASGGSLADIFGAVLGAGSNAIRMS